MSNAICYDSIIDIGLVKLRRGDIHIVNFGESEKYELSGERLCVVLQNDYGNRYSNTTIVAVISDKIKDRSTRFDICINYDVDIDAQICLEKIRTISKSRIVTSTPLGNIDIDSMRDKFIATFGFDGVNSFYNKDMKYIRGGIYYVNLGEGEGSEQTGKRPCVVIQNDVGNWFSKTVIIAPITSQNKRLPTHYLIENYNEVGLGKLSQICFEQVRTISKSRIMWDRPIGKLNVEDFKNELFKAFGLKS